MNTTSANTLSTLSDAMTFDSGMLCDGREAGRRGMLGGLFCSEISTGSSSKTSSESSSSRAVAVLLKSFDSVVIDFRRGTLTIRKSPKTRAFLVVSVASSAVLNNLRQQRGIAEMSEKLSDSDPRLQILSVSSSLAWSTARAYANEARVVLEFGVPRCKNPPGITQ